MNNKGFAVSGILYTILLIFLALLMMLLFNFEGKKNILDNIKSELYNDVNDAKYFKYENGTAIYFNPETGNICSESLAVSTTGTKTGCMKWYIFNDSDDKSSVDMILDHNTTAQIVWNSTGSNTVGPDTTFLSQLKTDTSSWLGVATRTDNYVINNGAINYTIDYNTYKARIIKASEIAKITTNNTFNETTSSTSNWFYLDSNTQTQTITTLGASNYKWLFDYTNGCTSYGCSIADASTYGYWTSTAVASTSVSSWMIHRNGYQYLGTVNGTGIGIRPVITISKSVLTTEICDINLNQEYLFDYTGSEQEFTVPCNGNYKIETWGAGSEQTSSTPYGIGYPGYGGYATGIYESQKDTKLYISVGGLGLVANCANCVGNGGYNGGAQCRAYSDGLQFCSGGGGATHIALKSGLLSSLASYKDNILIVAGGAGGAWSYSSQRGESGGGYNTSSATQIAATGGAGFGYGSSYSVINNYYSSCYPANYGAGGGGGFYGGRSNCYGRGGSGTGYISNELLKTNELITKHMTCYSCSTSTNADIYTNSTTNISSTPTSDYAKQGNGYAKITYLGN